MHLDALKSSPLWRTRGHGDDFRFNQDNAYHVAVSGLLSLAYAACQTSRCRPSDAANSRPRASALLPAGLSHSKGVHDLTVPVWTGHPLRIPYTSILAEIDSSDEAEAVIPAAAAFAASYKAELSLAYVMEMPPVSMETAFGPYRDDFMAPADARLVELKKKAGVNAPHSILDGPVADAIHDQALRISADLIITGRGEVYGTLSRLWSHLYPIVRHAPCPVLSI